MSRNTFLRESAEISRSEAASLEESGLGLEWFPGWILSHWLILLEALAAVATILGVPLAIIALRKPRWHKYRCRGLPYGSLFRGEEYGYNSKTFLRDVKSVDIALKKLGIWYAEGTKPLLIKGVTGVGKSRLATEFIGCLGWGYRLWRKVLVPTPYELSEISLPVLSGGCILFLNDLHEFRDSSHDEKLKFYIESKKFKVVATIPTEKYDPNWSVLSKFIWEELSLPLWTVGEGRTLAHAAGMKFEPDMFKGTPLSVLAPAAEVRRSYELLSPGGKAILRVLKIIKAHLGCFADYELISALQTPECRFDYADFLSLTAKRAWCKTYGAKYLLADGTEEIIPYQVVTEDAYRLQTVLVGEE
jgi:hypothetical protein